MRNPAFGWSYPPGCSGPPEPPHDPYCEVCGHDYELGECICPECPECGEQGNAGCYKEHGLVLNQEQIDGQAEHQKMVEHNRRADEAADEAQYQAWKEAQEMEQP